MNYQNYLAGAALSATLLLAGTAMAADPAYGGDSLSARPSVAMTNMTMTVKGPNGYHSKSYSSDQAPSMSLSQNGGLADGLYKWELTGATNEMVKANPMGLDNGRGSSAREFVNKSATESGTFRVVNGSIVAPDAGMQEPVSPRPRGKTSIFDK